MTTSHHPDLCVIGAGSAGLSVAAGAVQLGKSVVLIEKSEMGGDCLNFGCVPSKALLAAAAAAQSGRDGAKFGVRAEPVVDFPAVMDHVRSVIAAIEPHDSQERFEKLGCTVIREGAAFTGPDTIVAGAHTVKAKRFVIATGSRAFIPPIDGLKDTPYLTNETIFSNRTRPDHLIVLGGGPIGLEMAQAHARLGARVTVVEGLTILNRDDPDAVDVVRQRLQAEGVTIIERAKATAARAANGGVELTLEDGRVLSGSHLLVAVGRRPNVDGLGLERAGVKTDKAGVVADAGLRTDNPRIFVAGDAAGGKQFTHVAGDHASTLVRRILFKAPAKRRDDLAPQVTYTDPELASVGLPLAAATERDPGAKIVTWSFDNNDRAQAERRTDGFIKAAIAKDGAILGATIVGKGAGEQISLWAYAISNGLKIRTFTNMIAPYPTRSEISKRAASAFYTPTLFSDRTRGLVKFLSMLD